LGEERSAQAVQDELGTKVEFENDVNLAALGEQWLGLGKGVRELRLPALWGRAVGAGLILRGELYRGHTGAAGEVGYLPIGGDPRDKVLRRRGVLDTEAGASGVVATARRLGMEPPLSPRKVFAAARRGDRIARRSSSWRPTGSRSRPPRSCRSSTRSWSCWGAGSVATATCCSSR
jgi:predicted NBD/HSP70 family sugar kinase